MRMATWIHPIVEILELIYLIQSSTYELRRREQRSQLWRHCLC